ncbi:hypothetical protein C8Q77DRAFT_1129219 [Trametes polyzona]|nr:hypothetical protein C8Q77DRAFT_1129219 [Trametes polyzona]
MFSSGGVRRGGTVQATAQPRRRTPADRWGRPGREHPDEHTDNHGLVRCQDDQAVADKRLTAVEAGLRAIEGRLDKVNTHMQSMDDRMYVAHRGVAERVRQGRRWNGVVKRITETLLYFRRRLQLNVYPERCARIT